MDVWKPEFRFQLIPVVLDEIEVLRALLRDSQEKIKSQELKIESQEVKIESQEARITEQGMKITVLEEQVKKKTSALLSLTTCDGAKYPESSDIRWNGRYTRLSSYFKVSDDHSAVTILQKGLYQVSVQITCIINGSNISLKIDGCTVYSQRIMQLYTGNGRSEANLFFDILEITENSVLTVFLTGNAFSLQGSKLNILLLTELV